jgi:signal peptidase I
MTGRKSQKSAFREYFEAILIAVVLALLIRQFIVQAFKIPSGSMIPTLQIGDHLLVNKLLYRFRDPRRGEIVVFKFPRDKEQDFIKRVIGLPGEEVALKDGVLFIDGVETDDSHADYESTSQGGKERSFAPFRVPVKGDTIRLDSDRRELYGFLVANELGIVGRAKVDQFVKELVNRGSLMVDGKKVNTWVVQHNYIFMMGDNRDNSYDSRFWGPVDVNNLVGKAMILYWSFDDSDHYFRIRLGTIDFTFRKIRWSRIGDVIH